MRKIEFFLLTLILLGAGIVRLYKFTGPIADWHSWRQSDTSSVSRNFIKYGFDVLHPRFDDLSNGVSLIDNPQGYRFVEFPIYNLLQAGLFKVVGYFTLEEWGRLISISSSLGGIVFLYLIAKKYISQRAALAGAFFYAFLPYNIYYSRTVLPDPLMISMLLGGIYFFDSSLEENFKFPSLRWGTNFKFILAIIFVASAILIKPFVLFFGFSFVYLLIRKYGMSFIKSNSFWIFLIISVLPFIAWRLWIQQFPEGIPRNDWLFNGNHIRFKGAFFWWIFAERISRLILGYWGLPIVLIGIMTRAKKEGFFFYSLLLSCLLYIFVLATGNVQHDYYQILIIPTLAILFAKGVETILTFPSEYVHRKIGILVICLCSIFMILFGWYIIRDFYNINHPEIIEAGKAVDRLTPKDAKVIAAYNGDTTFLYQTNRQGWPVVERSFKDFLKAGAAYMVFVNPSPDELNLSKYFYTLERGNSYIVFDLTRKLPESREILK